jgi:hypothetical protein
MSAYVIEITATIRVRPAGVQMGNGEQPRRGRPPGSGGRAGAKPGRPKTPDATIAARPNGAGKRGRGRPPLAPRIIALLPDLARFHGNRIMLAEVTAAAIAAGIVAPAERGTPNWYGRKQLVKRALATADLGEVEVVGL